MSDISRGNDTIGSDTRDATTTTTTDSEVDSFNYNECEKQILEEMS